MNDITVWIHFLLVRQYCNNVLYCTVLYRHENSRDIISYITYMTYNWTGRRVPPAATPYVVKLPTS